MIVIASKIVKNLNLKRGISIMNPLSWFMMYFTGGENCLEIKPSYEEIAID